MIEKGLNQDDVQAGRSAIWEEMRAAGNLIIADLEEEVAWLKAHPDAGWNDLKRHWRERAPRRD